MSKNQTTLAVNSFTIDNNEKTGLMDWQFTDGVHRGRFSIPPMRSISILNAVLLRLMYRQEPEVLKGLQTFAIREIEAKLMPDGRPYLKYTMENGLGFGSGLEREKLEALYQQLGEVLGASPPKETLRS